MKNNTNPPLSQMVLEAQVARDLARDLNDVMCLAEEAHNRLPETMDPENRTLRAASRNFKNMLSRELAKARDNVEQTRNHLSVALVEVGGPTASS